jgi:hypothetical protein
MISTTYGVVSTGQMRYQGYMLNSVRLFARVILGLFRTRRELLLENLVLRQQLMVLKRKHPRTRVRAFDKLFWVLTRRFWPGWKRALILVTPETVVRWHRAGFQLYWKVISRVPRPMGRRQTPQEVRESIFRMVAENPRLVGSRLIAPPANTYRSDCSAAQK